MPFPQLMIFKSPHSLNAPAMNISLSSGEVTTAGDNSAHSQSPISWLRVALAYWDCRHHHMKRAFIAVAAGFLLCPDVQRSQAGRQTRGRPPRPAGPAATNRRGRVRPKISMDDKDGMAKLLYSLGRVTRKH